MSTIPGMHKLKQLIIVNNMELFMPKVKLSSPSGFLYHLKYLCTLKLHCNFTLNSLQCLVQLEGLIQHDIEKAKETMEGN